MNRLEIRDASRKKLGETTASFWTDAEINNYINLGCKDLAWRTKSIRANGYMGISSCTSNTVATVSNEYTISSYFSPYYAINEVYFLINGMYMTRLTPSSREELDALFPGWQSLVGVTNTVTTGTAAVTTYNYNASCGTPTKYYWSREEDVLGFYPPPNYINSGTNYAKVYYSVPHADLSGDADVPTLPLPLHLAIVDFVAATGLEDRGWAERANDIWQKYFSKIKDYSVEKQNEREDDDIVSKSYKNLYRNI